MRPEWKKAVTSCIQRAPGPEDYDYEPGVMALWPFEALYNALSDSELLSMMWFALADVAVWPQVPVRTAKLLGKAITQAITTQAPLPVLKRMGIERPLELAGLDAARMLLEQVQIAEKRVMDPAASRPNPETLWEVINSLSRLYRTPDLFWPRWIQRVPPASVAHTPTQARSLALKSVLCTLDVPESWGYETAIMPELGPSGEILRLNTRTVTPFNGWEPHTHLGFFDDFEPRERCIDTTFTPAVPIDPYRMGYFFRTCFLSVQLEDEWYEGRYDRVRCTNIATGEVWAFDAL